MQADIYKCHTIQCFNLSEHNNSDKDIQKHMYQVYNSDKTFATKSFVIACLRTMKDKERVCKLWD